METSIWRLAAIPATLDKLFDSFSVLSVCRSVLRYRDSGLFNRDRVSPGIMPGARERYGRSGKAKDDTPSNFYGS
ncbi:hypothetical protein E9229_000155 [Paeniglutamicibacter cryotolerans]|uniref:Uncharacterized protein n=1 Tax=Paeniglutamicibacter cryotolerans TaxID=670079 RepID=A0A839QGW3_9MICC|nr:hypothetical protein [Paeniglutamicibacter cryotolerans]